MGFHVGQRVIILWYPEDKIKNFWNGAVGTVKSLHPDDIVIVTITRDGVPINGGFKSNCLRDWFTSVCEEALKS